METKATPKAAHSTPSSLPSLHQTTMVDLHGLSVERAQDVVALHIKQARSRGWNKIRFVTGRGNHINARGERGTLYKNFKDWLKDLQGNLVKIDQYDGYYEVDIKDEIAVRNPFSAFMNEYVQRLLKDNIEETKQAAAKGEPEAMTALACCYDRGIGVEQSYQKATALYIQLAEEEKLALAQHEAGCRFYIGKGIKQNDVQAIKFLKLAADQNFVLAEFLLAEIYRKGFDAVSIDHAVATKYYFKAAQHGHAEAARKLGCAYDSGEGIAIDYAQAIHWWEKACALGDCVAAFNLSAMYQDGKGVSKDPKKTVYYLRLAAEYGDPDGQQILGYRCYYGDKDIPKDEQKGLEWLRRAATNGSSQAQFFLSMHHKSLNEIKSAKEYLVEAALGGLIEAQFLIVFSPVAQPARSASIKPPKEDKSNFQLENKTVKADSGSLVFDPELHKKIEERLLGQPASAILQMKDNFFKHEIAELLLCGDSTKKQMKKGIAILEQLAEEKSTKALGRLGVIYTLESVKIIKKDVKKGHAYWLRGAALGDSDCLCSLGYFWYQGAGGVKDHKKAYDYFIQAAERGNANATNMLGTFYKDGDCGIKKDFKKAVEYFQRAMELDNPAKRKELHQARGGARYAQNVFKHASMNLGVLYLKGDDGFPKDEAKGVTFLRQSAEDGMDVSALLLWSFLGEKQENRESLYYLNLAAQLGNEKAIKLIEAMPAELKLLAQQPSTPPEDKGSDKAPISKEELREKLKQLSSCLTEELDWKIPGDDRAWAYISDNLQKKLIQFKELSQYIQKAKDGRHLIVINNVGQCNLDAFRTLFEKAAIPPSLAGASSGVASIARLLAKNSFLAHNSSAASDTNSSLLETASSLDSPPSSAVAPLVVSSSSSETAVLNNSDISPDSRQSVSGDIASVQSVVSDEEQTSSSAWSFCVTS